MTFAMAQDEKGKEKASVFVNTYFRAGLVFHFVAGFGIALICYVLYPDWMLMYYADNKKVPPAMIGYIFSGYFAMYTLGFLLVPHLRERRERLPRDVFMSLMALIFAFIFVSFHRLWRVGEYDGYHRGDTRPITSTGLLPVLGVAMPASVGALVAVLRLLGKRFSGPTETD